MTIMFRIFAAAFLLIVLGDTAYHYLTQPPSAEKLTLVDTLAKYFFRQFAYIVESLFAIFLIYLIGFFVAKGRLPLEMKDTQDSVYISALLIIIMSLVLHEGNAPQ